MLKHRVAMTFNFDNIKDIYDLQAAVKDLKIDKKNIVLCTLLDQLYEYIISLKWWHDGEITDIKWGEKYINLFIYDPKKTIELDSWEEYKTIVGGEKNIYNFQDIYKDINKNVSTEIILTKLKRIFNNAILTSASNSSFKHIGLYNTSIAVMHMINHLEISYNKYQDSSNIGRIQEFFKERLDNMNISHKRKATSQNKFNTGNHVLALYPPDKNYYGAIVLAVNMDSYKVKWDNGTKYYLIRPTYEVCSYSEDRDFNMAEGNRMEQLSASASASSQEPPKRRKQSSGSTFKDLEKDINEKVSIEVSKMLTDFEKDMNEKVNIEVNKKFSKMLIDFEKKIDTKIGVTLLNTENSEIGHITNLKKILVEQIHSERETFNKLKNDTDDVAKLRKSIRANINAGANSFAAHINTYTTKVTNDYNKWTSIVDSTTTNIHDIEKKFKESIKNFTTSINQLVNTKVTSIGLDITRMSDKFKTLIDEQTLNIEGQSNTFIDCMKNITTKINEQITNMQKFMRIEIPQIKI